ncbi:hypothetical protein PR048_012134 [Dryococelus australis]|uniref:Uncharacterized protein n=1 Tax=Dryococelus australis TaxID=614101 RepID=A0ABQ9HNJ2_9NEOP|nr:hypothetical protein PR048_012134 [Dryococelus australis]
MYHVSITPRLFAAPPASASECNHWPTSTSSSTATRRRIIGGGHSLAFGHHDPTTLVLSTRRPLAWQIIYSFPNIENLPNILNAWLDERDSLRRDESKLLSCRSCSSHCRIEAGCCRRVRGEQRWVQGSRRGQGRKLGVGAGGCNLTRLLLGTIKKFQKLKEKTYANRRGDGDGSKLKLFYPHPVGHKRERTKTLCWLVDNHIALLHHIRRGNEVTTAGCRIAPGHSKCVAQASSSLAGKTSPEMSAAVVATVSYITSLQQDDSLASEMVLWHPPTCWFKQKRATSNTAFCHMESLVPRKRYQPCPLGPLDDDTKALPLGGVSTGHSVCPPEVLSRDQSIYVGVMLAVVEIVHAAGVLKGNPPNNGLIQGTKTLTGSGSSAIRSTAGRKQIQLGVRNNMTIKTVPKTARP